MRLPGRTLKISDAKVREIRGQWWEWKAMGSRKGYGQLGRIFGISMWTIRDIVTYRRRRGI